MAEQIIHRTDNVILRSKVTKQDMTNYSLHFQGCVLLEFSVLSKAEKTNCLSNIFSSLRKEETRGEREILKTYR